MNRPAVVQPLVVQRTQAENEYLVYAASDPHTRYVVRGTAQSPQCSCPDFAAHGQEPEYRCEHIAAVFGDLVGEQQAARPALTTVTSVNRQRPTHSAFTTNCDPPDDNPVIAVLRRSISPDGRINSLSIELPCPLNDNDFDDCHAGVEPYLALQEEIVAVFLELHAGNGKPTPEQTPDNGHNGNGSNGSVPAHLLDIASMRTRYGWRTFLNVQADGQTFKLFGDRRQLAEQITAAGYGHLARSLSNGTALNVPCQAVLEPSEDGRYTNVVELLPAQNGRNGGSRAAVNQSQGRTQYQSGRYRGNGQGRR